MQDTPRHDEHTDDLPCCALHPGLGCKPECRPTTVAESTEKRSRRSPQLKTTSCRTPTRPRVTVDVMMTPWSCVSLVPTVRQSMLKTACETRKQDTPRHDEHTDDLPWLCPAHRSGLRAHMSADHSGRKHCNAKPTPQLKAHTWGRKPQNFPESSR